jgi:hypothetical protein
MKNQAWPSRENMRVELLNGNDKMAWYDLVTDGGYDGEEENQDLGEYDGQRCNIF